jgi:hypothetical protein
MDVPDGIIANLTRECSGNVHNHHVVEVTSRSFEKETLGDNPYSGAYKNDPLCAAKNVADLETDSFFGSAYLDSSHDILHTCNNWICYDFKERRIVPTHYTIRTYWSRPGYSHLKAWFVETSPDRSSWREVTREEGIKRLNGCRFTATFSVAGGRECRFIRLVTIGRKHYENDQLRISAREVFENLIELRRPIPPMSVFARAGGRRSPRSIFHHLFAMSFIPLPVSTGISATIPTAI